MPKKGRQVLQKPVTERKRERRWRPTLLVVLLGLAGIAIEFRLKLKTLDSDKELLWGITGSIGWALVVVASALSLLPSLLSFVSDVLSLSKGPYDVRRVAGHPHEEMGITRASSLSEEDNVERRWLVTAGHGAIGGALTGPVFLIFYYIRDFGWSGTFDISERHLSRLCPTIPAINVQLVEKDYPTLLSLLPEFLGFGFLVGLVIAALLPGWRTFLTSLVADARVLSWMSSPYASAITFGLIWGGLLGAVANPIFFGQNDGRPFMKLSTAAYAAQVAITLYLVLQLFTYRRTLPLKAITRAVRLGVYALVFPLFFLSLDHFGNLSAWSYCNFYLSWDSVNNQVVPGARPVLVGAAYGAWIGVLVMWVVGGYLSAVEAVAPPKLTGGTESA